MSDVGVGFILSALLGALVGWVGGMMIKGKGFGPFWNIIVGAIGGFTGGCLFYVVTLISYNVNYHVAFAAIGAILIMCLAAILKKKQ